MYYYKARMYSPTLARFMQTDPIGYADGMNMYAYVGGDPVNYVDPLGLEGFGLTCTSEAFVKYATGPDGERKYLKESIHTHTECSNPNGELVGIGNGHQGGGGGDGSDIVVTAPKDDDTREIVFTAIPRWMIDIALGDATSRANVLSNWRLYT